jgi:hypothetical protein
MVDEKEITFRFFHAPGDDGAPASSTSMSITFPWIVLFLENECASLCSEVRNFPKLEGLSKERRHVPQCVAVCETLQRFGHRGDYYFST